MINIFYNIILPSLICYLLGSFPTGLVISKLMKDDIRKHGSGNIGSTNMTRTYGKNFGKITFAGDILKSIIGWVICSLIFRLPIENSLFAQSLIIIGHCFSIFLKFKGGKGVATSLALAFLNNPLWGLLPIVLWNVIYPLTKIVSLSSILAFLITNIIVLISALFIPHMWWYLLLITVCDVVIIIRHIDNIKRLIKGEEYSFKKTK